MMINTRAEQFWLSIRILCVLQLVSGVLSMVSGMLLLIEGSKDRELEWPVNSGAGLWAGFMVNHWYMSILLHEEIIPIPAVQVIPHKLFIPILR